MSDTNRKMKEVNGENPQNARIKIKFTGKAPKVRFSYPVSKKETRTMGSMGIVVFFVWFMVNVIPLFIFVNHMEEKRDNAFNKSDFELSNKTQFVEYYTQEERIDYYYRLENYNWDVFWEQNWYTIIGFFWIMFGWMPIYYPFKKKWNKKYPDTEAKIANKKFRRFTSKDIIKRDGEIFVELPIFHNVVCDFEVRGDFRKELIEFEIREYKFEYYKIKRLKGGRRGRRKNEQIWYARWYYRSVPKEGNMEVVFA